jgi:hypothetical protein
MFIFVTAPAFVQFRARFYFLPWHKSGLRGIATHKGDSALSELFPGLSRLWFLGQDISLFSPARPIFRVLFSYLRRPCKRQLPFVP